MWHLCREMSEEDYFIIVSVIERTGLSLIWQSRFAELMLYEDWI